MISSFCGQSKGILLQIYRGRARLKSRGSKWKKQKKIDGYFKIG
jgi:hypothetical protein